jgi:hypothetical protein
MFGWRPRESSNPSLIYPNALSYFLPLSYIISQSKLVLNEAEQCLHSAPTTKVQRYDFIQSEHERKLSFPQFCDPAMASTGCGAPPTHDLKKG